VTSTDDSWLLTFIYVHSAHQVVVDLDYGVKGDLTGDGIVDENDVVAVAARAHVSILYSVPLIAR